MPDKMEEEEITSTSDMSIAPLIDIDAYAPVKMANRVGQLGVAKANLGFLTTFFLSVNAGVFIALGIQLAMKTPALTLKKNVVKKPRFAFATPNCPTLFAIFTGA